MRYATGDRVEVREFGKWRANAVVIQTMLGQGPDGEDLYIVECDQETPEGVKRMHTGAKTERMIRPARGL